jgi:ABC-type uncharacterized transport system substrate-binding protein
MPLGRYQAILRADPAGTFVERLRELGWIDHRNIAIEYRWAEGREERFAAIAAEFDRMKVDVIVTSGAAVIAARQAAPTTPIVFAVANDPLAAAIKDHADAVFVCGGPLVNALQIDINIQAAALKIPTMHVSRGLVAAGGLISYGAALPDLFRRAADYVHKILLGAKTGDLPVEQPTKFELVINLKTAKALGLEVPLHLQQRADEVIE